MESAEPANEARRQNGRSFFWGLVAVAIVAMVCTTISTGNFPDLRMAVHLSAIVFICSLLGFWMGLGTGGVRFVTAFLASMVVGAVFSLSVGQKADASCLIFCTGITTITAAAASIVRSFSGGLVRLDSVKSVNDSLQFGIKHLLIWTTVVAVVTPVIQSLELDVLGRDMQIICTLTLAYSLVAAFQISVFLHQRLDALRVVSTITLIFAAGSAIVMMLGEFAFWFIVTIFSQTMVAFSLLFLRMQDYRFVPKANS